MRHSDRSFSDDVECRVFEWHCAACTFRNVRRVYVPNDRSNEEVVACKICSTPYIVSASANGSRKQPRLSNLPSASLASQRDDAFSKKRDDTDALSNPTALIDRTGRSRSSSSSRGTKTKVYNEIHNDTLAGDTSDSTNASTTPIPSTARNSSSFRDDTNSSSIRNYSMSELIKSLNSVDGEESSSSVDLPPTLARRVQDFKFAQRKRLEKYGNQRPWGIYGLYSHLSDVRADLEWAEDAAWRRQRNEPYLSWKDFDKLSHDARGDGRRLTRYGNRPIFTYALLFVCTVMMFVTFGVNGWKFEPIYVNPLIGPSQETLIKCGARDTYLIVNEGQWYRLFTPIVLHAGIIHYLVNMLALFFIGGAVEKAHGIISTAVFFVIPAVGGNILSAIFLPGFISVGASGGIFGLIGGCLADICLNWNFLFLRTAPVDEKKDLKSQHFCVLLWLAIDIIINTLIGFTPFVDNFTHLGGFIYGFCIGFASIERLASGFFGIRSSFLKGGDSCWYRFTNAIFRYFGLIVSVIVIMVTTVILIQSDGVTSPCHGCRYISCVPFPPNSDDKWWYCDDCDVVTADLFRSTTTVLNLNDDDFFNGFETDDDVIPVGSNGLGLYEQVNINCPNGDVEEITILQDGIYDTEELRRELPSYCRAHCDDVFAT